MRVLITGGAGFIGSHLAEAYVALGAEVHVLDDFSVGAHVTKGAKIHKAGCDQIQHVDNFDWDLVFHLAARIGVGAILVDPLRMLDEHAEDIYEVSFFAASRRAKLILASTSEVYGGSTNRPLRESHSSVIGSSDIPRWGYAVTKLYAEHYALAMHRQHGVPVVIPRFFNVAGARQAWNDGGGCVLPIFARHAVLGETITIHGNGSQRRSFSHVSDVVRALIALAASEDANGQIVNVGHGHGSRSILELALEVSQYVKRTYGVECSVKFDENPDPRAAWGAMADREPDVSKLSGLIGFELPDRFPDIVREVCDRWWLELRGV